MATAIKIPGYELTFVTKVELSDDALKALKDRVLGVIAAYGGESVYGEDWGKRKFAYPIQKEVRGHYTYMVFTGKGDIIAEVERNLRLNDTVLRFMSVNLAKEFDKEVFMKELAAGTPLKREDKPSTPETTASA